MLSERKYKKTNENDIEGKDEDHRGEKCNLLDCLHDGMDFPNVRHRSQQVLLNEPSRLCQLAVCYAWRQAIGVIIERRKKKKKTKAYTYMLCTVYVQSFTDCEIFTKFLFPQFPTFSSLSLSLAFHRYILYEVLRFDESLFFLVLVRCFSILALFCSILRERLIFRHKTLFVFYRRKREHREFFRSRILIIECY